MSRRNRILHFNPKLRGLARALRKSGNLAEVVLWRALKGKTLGCEFHRQVPIGDYIVDFFCHEQMVAVEIDGSSHEHPERAQSDCRRDEALNSLGVRVLHVRHQEVLNDINSVMERIRGFVGEDEESNT